MAFFFAFIKKMQLLRSGYCTGLRCDFNRISINCWGAVRNAGVWRAIQMGCEMWRARVAEWLFHSCLLLRSPDIKLTWGLVGEEKCSCVVLLYERKVSSQFIEEEEEEEEDLHSSHSGEIWRFSRRRMKVLFGVFKMWMWRYRTTGKHSTTLLICQQTTHCKADSMLDFFFDKCDYVGTPRIQNM